VAGTAAALAGRGRSGEARVLAGRRHGGHARSLPRRGISRRIWGVCGHCAAGAGFEFLKLWTAFRWRFLDSFFTNIAFGLL